jgi:3-oxoadipate CoA-transferase beta subunit
MTMPELSMPELSMEEVAAVIAADIPEGSCVNLGIGLPLRVASFVPAGREIVLHSENGVLGVGPRPADDEVDWDLIDAGKNPITLVPGASFISHADSFALIRGGHIDVAVMGAYQVSADGDLANWWMGDGIPAVGGAMDLAACARSVYVVMRHNERDGSPKIVKACTVPLTAPRVVTRVYTELGVFSPGDGVVVAEAIVAGGDIDHIRARTAAPVELAPTCYELPTGQRSLD